MGLTITIHKKVVSRLTARFHGDSSQQRLGPSEPASRIQCTDSNTKRGSIHDVPKSLPTPLECQMHLRLLKVFANLKQEISARDGLFDIMDADAVRPGQSTLNGAMSSFRDKRWEVYVARAADRFEKWWKSMTPRNMQRTCKLPEEPLCSTPGISESLHQEAVPFKWTKANLPPVDVLMVLHSFMLNPRCYLQDCSRYNILSFWHTGFPWELVDRCIDESTYQYEPSDISRQNWEVATGLGWDNVNDTMYKRVACPSCDTHHDYEWTTANLGGLEDSFRECTGYADKSFAASCKCCNNSITKDLLSIKKLKSNIRDLQQHDIPLPGTFLAFNGQVIPQKSSLDASGVPTKSDELLSSQIWSDIMQGLDIRNQSADKDTKLNLDSIHQAIRSSLPSTATRTQRALLDRFLATTTQPSIFSLSLADAVLRQGAFIDTMQSTAWLFSPALDLTLGKLLSKYPHFFTVMAEHPDKIAVPTYAVDLAWHTHQLTPKSYYEYSIARTNGIFIDHDDKLGDDTLSGGFEFTKVEFEKLMHGTEEYGECLCWHCMTLQVVKASNPGIKLTKAEARTREQIARAQYQKLEVDFAVEVDRAKRLGRGMPDQEAFLKEYVWLYPDARPILDMGRK